MTTGPETTADHERNVPTALRSHLERMMIRADWQRAVEEIENAESRVDALVIAELDDEDLESEFVEYCSTLRIPDTAVRSALAEQPVSSVVYAVSALLAEWKSMYLDFEKLVGHLVLDHRFAGDLAPTHFHELLATHAEAHHAS